jgi:hypothetical protein
MNEYEYRTQSHIMWLEGTDYEKPSEEEIRNDAKTKGFNLENLEIWYDTMQFFWRFGANLVYTQRILLTEEEYQTNHPMQLHETTVGLVIKYSCYKQLQESEFSNVGLGRMLMQVQMMYLCHDIFEMCSDVNWESE